MGYFLGKREGMPADLMSILQKAGGVGGVSNPGQGVFKIPGLGATGGTPVPLGTAKNPNIINTPYNPNIENAALGTPNCIPFKACQADTDCGTGKCGTQFPLKGKCICQEECITDKPCHGKTDCGTGKCVGASLSQAGRCDCGGGIGKCSTTADCFAGLICLNGKCQQCTSDTQCEIGYKCDNGNCVKVTVPTYCTKDTDCPRGYICDEHGKCVEDTSITCTTDTDCPEGWRCINGKCTQKTGSECLKDADCPTGKKCVNSVCVSETDCGKGIIKTPGHPDGISVEGCPCSAGYYIDEGSGCMTGYHAVGSGVDARCECDKYIPPGDEDGLGAYDFPPELKALFAQLIARAQDLLGRKPGFSDTFLTNLFGQNMDKIRGAGAASNQGLMSQLQTEGMLGTGAGNQQLQQGAWNTQRNVGETLRDIGIANEGQKRTDLQAYTNLASQLGGQGAGFEQLRESINAGRRGEGQNSLALLLQYLMGLMSGFNQ